MPNYRFSKYAPRFLGVAIAANEFYRQNKVRIEGYQEMLTANTIFTDTPAQTYQYVTDHFLPYVNNGLQQTVMGIVSPAHMDWDFAVSSFFQSGKLHTIFTYPSQLLRKHFIKLSSEEPELYFLHFEDNQTPKNAQILEHVRNTDSTLLRRRMEQFICAHEATHANEFHNLALMLTSSALTGYHAFIVAHAIRLAAFNLNVFTAGLLFVTACGSLTNYNVTLDSNGKLARSETGPCHPDEGLIQSVVTNRLTLFCERRADAGAIRKITTHHSKEEASEILRAAKIYFNLSHNDTSDFYADMRFPTHPSSAERERHVQKAIETLELNTLAP